MAIKLAAGPDTLTCEALKYPTTKPPTIPVIIPENADAPDAEAIPRHEVGDVKSYLTGVKFYLQEMENENEKVVKEYQTILNQFHSDTQQNQ